MKNLLILTLSFICFFATSQEAQNTKIVVRTKAKDAKFIGTSMGGSLIIIKNAETGEILAQGKTDGGTGNTDLIMRTPKERYTSIGNGAAQFEASLSISKPIFLTIEALAPVNMKDSRVFAQTQTWLIPGKSIDGEGIIIEIPGFVIDGLYPQTHQGFSLASDKSIELKANIVMMCGCTISEGGLWDSNLLEVRGMVYVNGEYLKTVEFKNNGTPNTFTSDLQLDKTGSHEVIITAFDPKTNNSGVDELNFRVNN